MVTVVDLFRKRAETQALDRAFQFVDEGETWAGYAEIDRAARAIAAVLADAGAAGQPVLLLFPPGRSYVEGFLGCLYAGAHAVPAYPPDPSRLQRTLPRLQALIGDCGAKLALSVSWLAMTAQSLAGQAPELAALSWIATDAVTDDDATRWRRPAIGPESIALLQYTSGSTGTPKGVMLSHANLMHNLSLIREGFAATPDDLGVSWLPPYHDMGLIGGILQPVFTGLPIALMSPLTFLARPLTWLETISSLGATISGGPNFAFDLCVRKSTPQERAALDLSRWSLAFCGAEPVRDGTLRRFAEAFEGSGFRYESFYPCYGLAEATLIVTGGRRGAGPVVTADGHVGSGKVLGGQSLAIVDPVTGTVRPPGTEGEIWVSGDSVCHGYHDRPQETEQAVGARLAGDPRTYLRTGDLGRVGEDGELVVTGRIKDLIIVRGRNLYPQDLEDAVERGVPGVRPGCSAAFGFDRDGSEQVAFACETSAGTPVEATVAAIRDVLSRGFEVSVAAIALLEPGRIPKTSSGKIQRHACRRSFLDGDYPVVWREESLPDDVPLTQAGLDSMQAVELAHKLRTERGIEVSPADILSGVTLAELTARPARPLPQPPQSLADGDSGATDGQRALWFMQQWSPGSTVYQVSRAARVRAVIDRAALGAALEELVRRHPALRTSLPVRDGMPVQRRASEAGAVLAYREVSGVDLEELRGIVQDEADRPFDLHRGPLLRVTLYSRAADDHVILLSWHHAVSDFWSWTVLVDELLALYRGESLPPPGPPPAPEPVDEERLAYWRRTLDGAPHATDLPATYPRPRIQSLRGNTFSFEADCGAAEAFARDSGATLFTVLLAGWMATLARYAGGDVVTGITGAGRDDPRTRSSLGYFATPLPIRATLEPHTTFRALVAQVRQAVLGALGNAVPLLRLAEELRPARDPSRPALMQTMFVWLAPPAGHTDLTALMTGDESINVDLNGWAVSPLRLAERAAAFDLSLTLSRKGDRLHATVSYCADLFDEAAVARIAGHFTALTESAARDPGAPVGSLDLKAAGERDEVLRFARGNRVPPACRTLPEVLARQALLTPGSPALEDDTERLSYLDLDRRASALAARLQRDHAVKPGAVVGVRLPRGTGAVVAFWAVQKAGAIYLPLAPDLPPKRLNWMLEDAKPSAVVTEEHLRELPDRLPGADPSPVAVAAGDPAYLIYTSGSTGRPKGVLVGHEGVAALGGSLAATTGITGADRILQYASCAFDAWIAEVLTAHANGACLVVTPQQAAIPGPDLTDFLHRQRVTAAIFSPSTLAALPDAELPDLACVMSAGEACTTETVSRWGRGRRFYNLYGPTEATVCATGGAVAEDGRRPAIGGPIPNVDVYVLDGAGGLAPVGTPGELCIGGIGVAQGYLNQPELTAERFVANPFGPGRLYRSGDLVRWLPDGTLDFLGRTDEQVKIRGVRVEPGEVASRLRHLLGLREVAVVQAGTELVAYLAPRQPIPVAEIRALLRGELPGPWIPSAFVFLDSLPLNHSGKLNRSALPAPAAADRGVTGYLPPRTGLETAVAQVFGDVLQRSSIGIRDHFFDELGGTSLLVARVAAELSTRLDRTVPVTHLFEHPTVEALARRLNDDDTTVRTEVDAGLEAAGTRRAALARRRGER